MRTAIVHDWLAVYSGAERVLEQMVHALPEADLFSLLDFLDDEERKGFQGKEVTTSFIQRLPFARKKYRSYLPLFPFAIEQFDFSNYDIVVSSSYAVAKGVITSWRQLHISYVHTPIRYAWEMQFQYLREAKMDKGVRSLIARLIMHYMRLYDVSTANRVDVYVANSHHVAERIWKTYRRKATVIYPPVYTDRFPFNPHKKDFYVTVSRLVPYKKVSLIVEAFAQMPDKKLVVIGDGPDLEKVRKKAGANVKVMGFLPFDEMKQYMSDAKAFLFAAEEDFGIVAVEAQAAGTPVIAYGAGGLTESILDGQTGVFFNEQTAESIVDAVKRFESGRYYFDPDQIRRNAERFSTEQFQSKFATFVEEAWEQFQHGHLQRRYMGGAGAASAEALALDTLPVEQGP